MWGVRACVRARAFPPVSLTAVSMVNFSRGKIKLDLLLLLQPARVSSRGRFLRSAEVSGPCEGGGRSKPPPRSLPSWTFCLFLQKLTVKLRLMCSSDVITGRSFVFRALLLLLLLQVEASGSTSPPPSLPSCPLHLLASINGGVTADAAVQSSAARRSAASPSSQLARPDAS